MLLQRVSHGGKGGFSASAAAHTSFEGYVVGQIIEACIVHQKRDSAASTKAHPDPIHVSAHFLRASIGSDAQGRPMAFEVHVRKVKGGRDFTNLQSELLQNVSSY